MNGFTYASIAFAVLLVAGIIYGFWRYWRTPPTQLAEDQVTTRFVQSQVPLHHGPNPGGRDFPRP